MAVKGQSWTFIWRLASLSEAAGWHDGPICSPKNVTSLVPSHNKAAAAVAHFLL